jgi:hypothetical protein
MFLSRTVAAEVCMETKTNELAYAALKKLDHSGDLLFELSYVFNILLCGVDTGRLEMIIALLSKI